jgi:hypothetical protein
LNQAQVASQQAKRLQGERDYDIVLILIFDDSYILT